MDAVLWRQHVCGVPPFALAVHRHSCLLQSSFGDDSAGWLDQGSASAWRQGEHVASDSTSSVLAARLHFHTASPSKTQTQQSRRTQVLGTLITEWDAGRDMCCQLFASEAAAEQCASQLAGIAAQHGFEGWLINIENELPLEIIPHMLTFLR